MPVQGNRRPRNWINLMNNIPLTRTYRQPRAALCACRDPLSRLKATGQWFGFDSSNIILLSRADDPRLRTIDDVVAMLPESIGLLALDDAEYLLPPNERRLQNLRELIEAATIRYAHRRLTIAITTSLLTIPCPAIIVFRGEW